MMAPSRELLQALGADLQLPPAWRALAARAHATVERRWLVARIARPLLVAPPAARARLRRWLDQERGTPTPPMPPLRLRRVIRERLLYYGDDRMLGPVVEALMIVPPCVREAALAESTFLGVGANTRGWTGASRLVDRDDETRPRLVVLSGTDRHLADLTHTTLHELGHCWLLPPPFALATSEGYAAVRAVVAESAPGVVTQADAHAARDERLADACMWAWLCAGSTLARWP